MRYSINWEKLLSFTVNDEIMRRAVNLMDKYNSGIHIHIAEDLYDQRHCHDNYNKRVVERLNDFGVLNSSKTILGHCLHINDKERNIIRNSQAFVVQNMESNLNNKVGYFNAKGLGDKIMLGTDGMYSDMLQSAKAAFFVGQVLEKRITLNQFADITSTQAAKIFGLYPQKGEIAVGSDADLVIWNPETENIISVDNHHQNCDLEIYEGLKTIGASEVVIANGEVAVENEVLVSNKKGKFLKRSI